MREVYSKQLAIVVGVLIFMVNVIFALIQSPEILSARKKQSVSIPHPIEGYEQCDTCHGMEGDWPYPIRHLGWSNQSCTKCHLPAVSKNNQDSTDIDEKLTERIVPNPHADNGYDDCLSCHAIDSEVAPAPENHKGWKNERCGDCHVQRELK